VDRITGKPFIFLADVRCFRNFSIDALEHWTWVQLDFYRYTPQS